MGHYFLDILYIPKRIRKKSPTAPSMSKSAAAHAAIMPMILNNKFIFSEIVFLSSQNVNQT